MAENITVTILTKNSTKHLEECLQALQRFDEVVILDNGSTDNTMEIARTFQNVNIYENAFTGFGPLKILATEYSSNDWVLSLDSDEILSKELADEILTLNLEKDTVYSIQRDNYYNRKKITCCGWSNDWVNRLFNRRETGFNTNLVHESVVLNRSIQVKKLHNTLKHYTFDDASHLIKKMDHYSTLWASDRKGKKKSSPMNAFFRGLFTFFKSYILQKGFLAGSNGLVISVSNANGTFYKYMKLYEQNKSRDLQSHNNHI